MSNAPDARAPAPVLLAALLLVASIGVGISDFLDFLHAGYGMAGGNLPATFLVVLIPTAVLTVFPLAVVYGILRGVGWVRYLVVLLGAYALLGISEQDGTGSFFFRAWPWLDSALHLVAIVLLFLPSSHAWFRARRTRRADAAHP